MSYYTFECKCGCFVLDSKEDVKKHLMDLKETYKNDTYGLIDILFDAKICHIKNGEVVKETNLF